MIDLTEVATTDRLLETLVNEVVVDPETAVPVITDRAFLQGTAQDIRRLVVGAVRTKRVAAAAAAVVTLPYRRTIIPPLIWTLSSLAVAAATSVRPILVRQRRRH